jgi:hypothetical protein
MSVFLSLLLLPLVVQALYIRGAKNGNNVMLPLEDLAALLSKRGEKKSLTEIVYSHVVTTV